MNISGGEHQAPRHVNEKYTSNSSCRELFRRMIYGTSRSVRADISISVNPEISDSGILTDRVHPEIPWGTEGCPDSCHNCLTVIVSVDNGQFRFNLMHSYCC